MLSELIQPVLESKWAFIYFPFIVFLYLNYKALSSHKEKPESFIAAITWIKEDSFGQIYRSLLGWLLNRVGNLIGDQKEFSQKETDTSQEYLKKEQNKKIFSENPFTHQSYATVLRLAFIYPILSFILIWGVNGNISILNYQWLGGNGLSLMPVELRWQWLIFGVFIPIVLLIWLKTSQ